MFLGLLSLPPLLPTEILVEVETDIPVVFVEILLFIPGVVGVLLPLGVTAPEDPPKDPSPYNKL